MPKIIVSEVKQRKGSSYPSPFEEVAQNRIKQALGDAGGLVDFGVNITQLPPGEWSSQRHWHSEEDEFVYIISGTVSLITDEGEQCLKAGDFAAFPKNTPNGHHLINKSQETAVYLEIGSRNKKDVATYPDIDLHLQNGVFSHKNGDPY